MALFTRLRMLIPLKDAVSANFARFHTVITTSKPLLCRNVAPRITKRTYLFEIFRNPSQRELKIKDDVPDEFQLIYRNTMSKYILGAQIISLIAGGLVFIAFIMKSEFEASSRSDFQTWSPTARKTKNEEIYYISFFILFLVVMQVMISRTPIRIYKVSQTPKYISVNYGNYFLGKEKFSFQRGQVAQMGERGILPWRENRYVIESETERRVIILLEHYFRRPADLNVMLGVQKDPDSDQ